MRRVARPAGRDDVVPGVRAAARPREHVVDVLGGAVAVLAAVPVTGEHGPARQRHPVPVGHAHEVHEPDHRGHGHDGALGVELGAVAARRSRPSPSARGPRPGGASTTHSGSKLALSSSVLPTAPPPPPGVTACGSLPTPRRIAAAMTRIRAAPLEVRHEVAGPASGRPYGSRAGTGGSRVGHGQERGASPPPRTRQSRRPGAAPSARATGARRTSRGPIGVRDESHGATVGGDGGTLPAARAPSAARRPRRHEMAAAPSSGTAPRRRSSALRRSSTTSSASSRASGRRSASRSCACSPRATSSSRTCPASARRRWPRRSPARSAARGTGSSSRPTCCRPTSPASRSGTAAPATFEFRPGRRVRQRRARRRDQPRVAEDAVGAARGDGGAPGHRRRAHLPARRRRSWSSRRRTRSSSRAPIPCPRRSSTGSSCASRWGTPTATPSSRSSRPRARHATADDARPVADARDDRRRGRTRSRRVHVAPALAGYIVDLVDAHPPPPRPAPRREPARRARDSSARRARSPRAAGATTSCPTTCKLARTGGARAPPDPRSRRRAARRDAGRHRARRARAVPVPRAGRLSRGCRAARSLTRRGWTIAGAAVGLLVGGRVLGADERSRARARRPRVGGALARVGGSWPDPGSTSSGACTRPACTSATSPGPISCVRRGSGRVKIALLDLVEMHRRWRAPGPLPAGPDRARPRGVARVPRPDRVPRRALALVPPCPR